MAQQSPLDKLGDVGRGLLFVSLFAKGSALTQNGAGFLKGHLNICGIFKSFFGC
jgi:hypothetical protein